MTISANRAFIAPIARPTSLQAAAPVPAAPVARAIAPPKPVKAQGPIARVSSISGSIGGAIGGATVATLLTLALTRSLSGTGMALIIGAIGGGLSGGFVTSKVGSFTDNWFGGIFEAMGTGKGFLGKTKAVWTLMTKGREALGLVDAPVKPAATAEAPKQSWGQYFKSFIVSPTPAKVEPPKAAVPAPAAPVKPVAVALPPAPAAAPTQTWGQYFKSFIVSPTPATPATPPAPPVKPGATIIRPIFLAP